MRFKTCTGVSNTSDSRITKILGRSRKLHVRSLTEKCLVAYIYIDLKFNCWILFYGPSEDVIPGSVVKYYEEGIGDIFHDSYRL